MTAKTPPPADVIACGADPDKTYCGDCIAAYRDGIAPGETACDARYALLSADDTACLETVLDGHEYIDQHYADPANSPRARVEASIADTSRDAPVAGTWTDCTGNEALA